MKRKQALRNLLFVGFALVLAGGFASSCGDDDNDYYDDGKSGNNPHPTNKLLVSEVITLESIRKYSYDDQNRLVQITTSPKDLTDESMCDTTSFTYDQQGRIVSDTMKYRLSVAPWIHKEVTVYNHISDKEIVAILEVENDYDQNPQTIIYLDNKGQAEKICSKNGGDYFPDSEETLKYDAKGNIIERVYSRENYPDSWKSEYTYDNHYSPFSQIAKLPKWLGMGVGGGTTVNNCLTEKIGNNTTNYSYTYNSDGYPTKMEGGAEKVRYKYIPAK